MSAAFIGLMSGTSLDGVDGVLIRFDGSDDGVEPLRFQVLAHAHAPFLPAFADELLALNTPGDNELHRAALAGNAIAEHYAGVVDTLLRAAGIAANDVTAIGAHGQTVRHRPRAFDGMGYTLQIGNAALLAERTGIDVVADFRSADVAAGGLGAPLVPAFHQAVFRRRGSRTAVLNIGGIANITAVADDREATTGWDCGPGNVLLDSWCRQWTGARYDAAGAWSASGVVWPTLLAHLQADPYFAAPPPKATGRDHFHARWLEQMIARASDADGLHQARSAPDVQATLVELTAWACAEAIHQAMPDVTGVLVCGGGAHNAELMRRLQALVQRRAGPNAWVKPTSDEGLDVDQVEAAAFAWLARACLAGAAGNVPRVTGARRARVLGAVYGAA